MSKKKIAILAILLFVGLGIFLHMFPIKKYNYILSAACHPNLLENNGAEYRRENYRLVLGQKDEYDKAVSEIQKLNVRQDFKRSAGCEYSQATFELYLL